MISVEAYHKGFRDIHLSDNQKAMLRAHYQAPDHRITMTKLAMEVGYPSFTRVVVYFCLASRAKQYCLDIDWQKIRLAENQTGTKVSQCSSTESFGKLDTCFATASPSQFITCPR